MDDAISGHGDQPAAERMNTDAVDAVPEPLLCHHLADTVVA